MGNSMICSDIWHKLTTVDILKILLLFVINFHELLGGWNLRQFWNITSGIYAKYHVQIMLLFVYTTTHKGFVIFTRTSNWNTIQYSSWNTTAQSQSNAEISHVVV